MQLLHHDRGTITRIIALQNLFFLMLFFWYRIPKKAFNLNYLCLKYFKYRFLFFKISAT
jgi:hypothetical protein